MIYMKRIKLFQRYTYIEFKITYAYVAKSYLQHSQKSQKV